MTPVSLKYQQSEWRFCCRVSSRQSRNHYPNFLYKIGKWVYMGWHTDMFLTQGSARGTSQSVCGKQPIHLLCLVLFFKSFTDLCVSHFAWLVYNFTTYNNLHELNNTWAGLSSREKKAMLMHLNVVVMSNCYKSFWAFPFNPCTYHVMEHF